MPSFGAPKETVSSARTASPSTTPRRPVHAGGDVDGHHRYAGLVQARDRRRPLVLRHAAEAGPEDRVHGDVRSRELPPEAVLVERPHADTGDLVQTSSVRRRRLPELPGVLEQHHGGPHPPATELPSGHQAVAAVVALPADHHRSAAVRAARELARRPCHGTPRSLHEHVGRDTPSLRLPVERRGLVRGQDGFHRTAIANATAFDLS